VSELRARVAELEAERDEALGDLAQYRKMWDEFAKEHVPRSTHEALARAYDDTVQTQAEQIAALQEALRDEIAMAEQCVETLRGLHKNWERIIDEQDDDGDPLIENILYWLIEDVKPDDARAALALAEGCAAPAPEEEK